MGVILMGDPHPKSGLRSSIGWGLWLYLLCPPLGWVSGFVSPGTTIPDVQAEGSSGYNCGMAQKVTPWLEPLGAMPQAPTGPVWSIAGSPIAMAERTPSVLSMSRQYGAGLAKNDGWLKA